jgi:deazaflavin-dependent oxidoreductase (nitroreductase family)
MARRNGLRYVDPSRPRGRLYRAYVRALGTPVAFWLSRHVIWKLDPFLMRVSNGRLGFGAGLPSALLETRGARSGQVRRNAVLYFHDGDCVTIIASKLGDPGHPAWVHNLRAHPDDVTLAGRAYTADFVEDEHERSRLWRLADNVFPTYAIYRERAAAVGRTIPIVQLTPR